MAPSRSTYSTPTSVSPIVRTSTTPGRAENATLGAALAARRKNGEEAAARLKLEVNERLILRGPADKEQQHPGRCQSSARWHRPAQDGELIVGNGLWHVDREHQSCEQ